MASAITIATKIKANKGNIKSGSSGHENGNYHINERWLHGSNQQKQLKNIFMRFDMDSDGSLTQLELADLLWSLGVKSTSYQLPAPSPLANGNRTTIKFDELVTAMEVFQSFERKRMRVKAALVGLVRSK
ncbi:hypothetical protein PRUPE_2G195000 [Prunus persica]|uniref:Uncharacterized protein n=1 Tax=Prunus persica TaxID=3760 RepID=M5X4Y6_PRUPE|nr:hypothetical protein PRUPE_2G195000 [Prunus persica]